ncbi:MAG: hypothetical protein EXR21_09000 [Flavobacteriaceae bacterium]|nr:hypothetical protein [Flavobacteriaceae bacterium]
MSKDGLFDKKVMPRMKAIYDSIFCIGSYERLVTVFVKGKVMRFLSSDSIWIDSVGSFSYIPKGSQSLWFKTRNGYGHFSDNGELSLHPVFHSVSPLLKFHILKNNSKYRVYAHNPDSVEKYKLGIGEFDSFQITTTTTALPFANGKVGMADQRGNIQLSGIYDSIFIHPNQVLKNNFLYITKQGGKYGTFVNRLFKSNCEYDNYYYEGGNIVWLKQGQHRVTKKF